MEDKLGRAKRPSERGNQSLLMFSSATYYVNEGDGYASLDVMRIGDMSQEASVGYATQEASAKEGISFDARSGVLVFGPGVSERTIDIPIVQGDRWDTTVEFEVHLLRDEQLMRADLGAYNWRTRVKIIDDDHFPSNKYGPEILEGIKLDMLDEMVPHAGLFWEFILMNFWNPDITTNSVKLIILGQLHNLYLLLKLFLNVYLIDYVLVQSEESSSWLLLGSRMTSLIFVTTCQIIPFMGLHFLDWKQYSWRVPGLAVKTIQVALLRKFLDYNEASRRQINGGQLITAVSRDAVDVVLGGYMHSFMLMRRVGALCTMMGFHVIAPVFFQAEFSWVSFVPCLLFPMMLSCFVGMRWKLTKDHLKNKYERQVDVVNNLAETVDFYNIIADYSQRPAAADNFEEKVKNFGKANVDLLQVLENNHYAVPWLSLTVVVCYTLLEGPAVLEGRLSMGMFITNTHIFMEVGIACASIYMLGLDIQTVFPELERIVTFLNMETDVHERMELAEHRRGQTKAWRKALIAQGYGGEKNPVYDMMPIIVENVKPEPISDFHAEHLGEIAPFSVTLDQGRLITLLGPHGGGKSTFLRVLGGSALPKLRQDARFFIPAHLRVLHVPSDPVLFDCSLYQNLTFGCSKEDAENDTDRQRVKGICLRLGLPEDLCAQIQDTDADAHMEFATLSHISHTQKRLITLARALVTTPEVLVLHKPTLGMDAKAAKVILTTLRDFVDSRGLGQDADKFTLRRPRTCIYSTIMNSGQEVDMADDVFSVTWDGIKPFKAGWAESAQAVLSPSAK